MIRRNFTAILSALLVLALTLSVRQVGGLAIDASSLKKPLQPYKAITGGGPQVALKMPGKPLFVGTYGRIPVHVDPVSGLSLHDLEFVLPDGLAAGMVSLSRDRLFDPQKPSIMLGAGFKPGKYVLQVVKKGTGKLLTQAHFQVTDLWTDKQQGPSFWFRGATGTQSSQVTSEGAAWGGGPTGPQNWNVKPAMGHMKLAIVFVDTASQRYEDDAAVIQGYKDRWLNAAGGGKYTGAPCKNSAAKKCSVSKYYQEVSFGNLILDEPEAFGPIHLPESWEFYYYQADPGDGGWSPMGSFWQETVTASIGSVDFAKFNSVVFVSKEVPPSGSAKQKFAWPTALLGLFNYYFTGYTEFIGFNVKLQLPKYGVLGVISMPNDWTNIDGRAIYATLSHEFGHNLNLPDLYTPVIPPNCTSTGPPCRNLGTWELMDTEEDLPHLSLVHRMWLGWVNKDWIQTVNFGSSDIKVKQPVALHPIELGSPPPGLKSGIEIRIADGRNYYLEYRNAQGLHIGDQALPSDMRVVGTDVISKNLIEWTSSIPVPPVLLLPSSANGPVLNAGQEYWEMDNSTPTFPADFKVHVNGVAAQKADLEITYGVIGKPDPSIRIWSPPPWQSPDIIVENARSQADPKAWSNVLWEGNLNTITASVRNRGDKDAPNVVVNFYWAAFNAGGGLSPLMPLPSDQRDIPAGKTVDFKSTWTPPIVFDLKNEEVKKVHYCIIVKIPSYQIASASTVVPEMTALNNVAQSNYTKIISHSASPASREITVVEVSNPFSEAALVYLQPSQSNPLYRTYLEHTWLNLQPGETRKVIVMFEYAGTDYSGQVDLGALEKYSRLPNEVHLRAVIEDPRVNPRHVLHSMGGVTVQVEHGLATRFKSYAADQKSATGSVIEAATGHAVPGGQVILTLSHVNDIWNLTVPLAMGSFQTTLDKDWDTIRAYYVPVPGLSDCTSATLTRERR